MPPFASLSSVTPGCAYDYSQPGISQSSLRDHFRQEIGEEGVEHAATWIHRPHPLREIHPPLAIRSFDVLAFDKGALVEQGNPVALKGELVELPQESVPGGVVGARVNRIDGEDFLVVGLRQD